MAGSLPEMGEWDAVFDETYIHAFAPFISEERTREEALGAAALADLQAGAEVLDCPVGFASHALVLTEAGYRVTGVDRSEAQLADAQRRRGDAAWPRLLHGDYRALDFPDASFDAVLNLFTSLVYLERDADVGVLREFRRVLRPSGALIVETMHRDLLAHIFVERVWDRLPDGSLFLQERAPDWESGTVSTLFLVLTPEEKWVERRFVHHVYTVTE
jgi:ubiquinone/menaquinone biosynthesis C-methylase UbiE